MVFKSGFAGDKDNNHLNSAYLPILKAKVWYMRRKEKHKLKSVQVPFISCFGERLTLPNPE